MAQAQAGELSIDRAMDRYLVEARNLRHQSIRGWVLRCPPQGCTSFPRELLEAEEVDVAVVAGYARAREGPWHVMTVFILRPVGLPNHTCLGAPPVRRG